MPSGVSCDDTDLLEALRYQRSRNSAAGAQDGTVQAQLSEDDGAIEHFRQLTRRGQQCQCDGKVVGGSHLRDLRRGEIDGELAGVAESRGGDGGPDPVACFPNGGVGQAHDGITAPWRTTNPRLDTYFFGLDANQGD